MKFILERTSVYSLIGDYQTREEQIETVISIIGKLDIEDKVEVEQVNYTIYFNDDETKISKENKLVLTLNSLEELIDIVKKNSIVIKNERGYDYPVIEIYDTYRE